MYKAIISDQTLAIEFDEDTIAIDGQPFSWDLVKLDTHSFHIIHQDKSYRAEILSYNQEEKTVTVRLNNTKHTITVKDKMDLLLERLGMDKLTVNEVKDIKAPMPGLVLNILVNEGDTVQKGDQLMILEAMKMENVLKAPGEGVVKTIKVKTGDSVEKNQVMISF